jgi:hypothetical protein
MTSCLIICNDEEWYWLSGNIMALPQNLKRCIVGAIDEWVC